MSTMMMQPGDFMLVTRGRGYAPQQVDRVVGELVAVQQAAARRIVELEEELNGRQRQLTHLRERAVTMPAPDYDLLGEGARNLYRDAETEAQRLRERAAEEDDQAAVLLARAGQEAAGLRDRAWQAAHRIEQGGRPGAGTLRRPHRRGARPTYRGPELRRPDRRPPRAGTQGLGGCAMTPDTA